jgi:sugar lactone lactonase YvrE
VISLASSPLAAASAAGSSNNASVSLDGRLVAYESTATNLVSGQSNSGGITSNIFLLDRVDQITTLVSRAAGSPTPTGGNDDSFSAVISSNGRFVYYLSFATNLVSGQSGPGTENLFAYDTITGTTRLVTNQAGSSTQEANGNTGLIDPLLQSGAPFSVSASGTRVAYTSAATDLITGMTGSGGLDHPNVFVSDISGPSTSTVLISSQAANGTAGAGGRSPALSADGRWVAFVSDGSDLVPGQVEQSQPTGTNLYTGLFLYDTITATTTLVSRQFGTTATVASASSDTPAINQDGSVVAFRSDAADLVAGQSAASQVGNVFVYERFTDTVGLVSHVPQDLTIGAGGTPFTPDSQGAQPLSISGDGQEIVYQSQAVALVGATPQPGNPPPYDIYLWKLASISPGNAVDGMNFLVSGAGGAATTLATGSSTAPALSSDGSTLAFQSTAGNLVPGQVTTGGSTNVYLAKTTALLTGEGVPPILLSSANGSARVTANADSSGGALSQGQSPNLFPGSVGLSADGSLQVFQSRATNLSTSFFKANSGTDILVDSQTGLALATQSATPVITAGGNSYVTAVSADDHFSVLVSDAINLVANQQNNHFGLNVFVRDNMAQTITLVNHELPPGLPSATGDSGIPQPAFTPNPGAGLLVPPPPPSDQLPVISGDGSFVAFVSNDHNLVSGQRSPGSFNNVFRYRVADGSITLVSHLPNQPAVSGTFNSNNPVIDFDGRFIAFVSNGDLYLFDATAANSTLIAAGGSNPTISDDGRYVAYVAGGNAFLYDRLAGTSALVSHDAGNTKGTLLALTPPPATVTAGQPFVLTATVQDAYGNTDTSFNGMVTLGLGALSPTGASLSGSTTAQAINGVAHFNDVLLLQAGVNYAVTASAPGITTALTTSFPVTPAAASQLAFDPPPALSSVNQPLNPTVAVAVEDAFGNVVAASGNVVVSLVNNTTGASLSGTTTVATNGGIASFVGLSIDKVGTYQLQAAVGTGLPALPSVTSPQFSVTNIPAGLGIIQTIAGTHAYGFGGDGGPALKAVLAAPGGAAVDAAGDLFIADSGNNRIRKVTPAGIVTTVVGTGTAGFTGDGGPATAAELNGPVGLAFDAVGDLFIADASNERVREVFAQTGTITTVAGTGTGGFAGDGGLATSAELSYPDGVAVGPAGSLFIADSGNNRIREVSSSGFIATVAGNGTAGYTNDGSVATAAAIDGPPGIAADNGGDLFFVDIPHNVVREVSGKTGIINTVAGNGTRGFGGDGGPATAAVLDGPFSVTVDPSGDLFIAQFSQPGRIREVMPSGIITTVAGGGVGGDGGPAAAAGLFFTQWVAADSNGNLYLAENLSNSVREIFAAATKLAVIFQPPSTVSAGDSLTASVAVEDASGATVTGYSGPVNVQLAPGSAAVLQGATTVMAVNGVATFDLSLTTAASGYALLFTASGGIGIKSTSFDVTPLASSALVFGQQPINAVIGQPISPAVTVEIVDRYGNLETGDSSAVTLDLETSPGNAVVSETMANASQGIATFANLTSNSPGTFVLVGSSGFFAPVTSNKFSINRGSAVVAITTVAGDGFTSFAGDGGAATLAVLSNPNGVAVDSGGDLFIADTNNNRIREVSAAGIITTVAGTGTAGFSGDGAAATAAELSGPTSVVVDVFGNLFITDAGNNRIRRVAAGSGIITTFAGNGAFGFSGDGGPATATALNGPKGLAVDGSGNLLIADVSNNRVREVFAATGVITTVAGTGTAGFSGDGGVATMAELSSPAGVALDSSGNLFIADSFNHRIREVVPSGMITTIAGNGSSGFSGDGGPATAAGLDTPAGIGVDGSGDIFIINTFNARVREVSATTQLITTVAGNGMSGFAGDGGPATTAELGSPFGVAADSTGNIFVADTANHRIREVSAASGIINTIAGSHLGDGNLATRATISPIDVTADGSGDIFIADYGNNLVRKVSPTGTITTVAGNGNFGFSGDGGPATSASIYLPEGVAVDKAGDLFISDGVNYRVREVSAQTGIITTVAGNGTSGFSGDGGPATAAELGGPGGLAIDSDGNLYIADYGNQRIREVSGKTGNITTIAGNGTAGFSGDGGPATSAELKSPGSLALDNNNNLFFSDAQNYRVREIAAQTGTISTVVGTGAFQFSGDGGPATGAGIDPAGIAIDGAGDLFIADNMNRRVREVSAQTGIINTVTGGGSSGLGDGGSAAAAQLSNPNGLALNSAGNLFIADFGFFSDGITNRIREVINPANKVVVTTQPPPAPLANQPFTVVVTVEDANGNAVSGYGGYVTLSLSPNSPPGATLGGTTAVRVDSNNGTATFQDLTINHTGSGFTLVASSGSLTSAATAQFNVVGSAATRLAVTTLPPAITATVPFSVQITAEDASGNRDLNYTGPVSLALGNGSPLGASLSGTLLVNAQAGVATFDGLTINQPGRSFSLTATAASSGLLGVTTPPFLVGATTATQLVVGLPSGLKAGVPFTLTVHAEDGAGNLATGFNGSVTVAFGQNPTGAALSGILTVAAVNGIATFAVGISKPGVNYTLTASAASLPLGATAPFSVTATPDQLAILPPVSQSTFGSLHAGAPFTVAVIAQNLDGTTDIAFGGNITLNVGPGSPAGTFLSGLTTVVAVDGVATFSNLALTQGGSYTLTAATANLVGGFSSPFPVSGSHPSQLFVTPPVLATAGNTFNVTVAVQDGQGNTVPNYNGSVTVSLANNPTGATLSGITMVNAVNGLATFTLALDKSGSGYTLAATSGSLAESSTPFDVGGVAVSQLAISLPAFAVANVPFTVAVTAEDSSGNPVPTFNGMVALTLATASPAGAVLGGPPTVQASNGVAIFTDLSLAVPGTGYLLTAMSGAFQGSASRTLSVLSGGTASSDPVVSAQGNYVAYVSADDNLIAGQSATGFTNILLYQVATAANALVSGTVANPADANSDSPAIDVDGSYIAYRSDATNLINNQSGAAGNIFLFSLAGTSTTLVSAVSGNSQMGAGSSSGPAIDGNGAKIVYLSKANNLVAGQQPGTTMNVFLYPRPLGLNFLVTGQFGSATQPGNGDAFNAIISRQSVPQLSSDATDLVLGVGANSNAFVNKLITTNLLLQAPSLASGIGPDTTVGSFQSTISQDLQNLLTGQVQPPSYSLVMGYHDDGLFKIPGGGQSLLTGDQTKVDYKDHQSYQLEVQTDIGLAYLSIFGLDTLTVPVTPPLTETIDAATGQPHLTNGPTINFTVVFSSPVDNFTSAAVSLGGSANPTTALVTGSGTTYNVAVSGMTQPGSVVATVPAGMVNDANGEPNAASTSTNNTVLFTLNEIVTGVSLSANAALHTYAELQNAFADGNAGLGGPEGVTLSFSKDLSPATVSATTVRLDRSNNTGNFNGAFTTWPATVSLLDLQHVRLTLLDPVTQQPIAFPPGVLPNDTYRIMINGVTDISGQPLDTGNGTPGAFQLLFRVDLLFNDFQANPVLGLPGDTIGAGPVTPGGVADAILVNTAGGGDDSILVVNPLQDTVISRIQGQASGRDNGWVDPTDRTFLGDWRGDGTTQVIQFNLPAAGQPPAGGFYRVVDPLNGNVIKLVNYSDLIPGAPENYQQFFGGGLENPVNGLLIGHFTQRQHLEALFYNRANIAAGQLALVALDLVSGAVTFTSMHDGNVFSGWTSLADDYFAFDANNNGLDDLVLVNRVPDPQDFENTDKGFIGFVSLATPPVSSVVGFARFFAWNTRGASDAANVFPGYDDLGDHATAGVITVNGQPVPVILLVNSQPAVDAQGNPNPGQAVFATLRPMPLTAGVNDAFVIVSAPKPTASTGGFFTQANTFVMGNFQGTGGNENDAILSYNYPTGQLNIAVYDPLSGNLLGVMTSQDNTSPGGSAVAQVASATPTSSRRAKVEEAAWNSWLPSLDWFSRLDPLAQQTLVAEHAGGGT